MPRHASLAALAFASACSAGGDGPPTTRPDASTPPGDTCGSVRLTEYTAGDTGFCQWDRTRSYLPSFVRSGMTAAIGEPWVGGSYGGPPGAACGECWEVTSLSGSQIVMVHDLCPIEGNPICAGSFFHFDLADEAGAVLLGNGISEAAVRRVPCPVSGNVHAQVNDQNPGYVRLSFTNHRRPIERAFVRGDGPGVAADNPWVELGREGGAFVLVGTGMPLARGGTGLAVRLVASTGEELELPTPIPTSATGGLAVDLGAQLADESLGTACAFRAPADVFVDGFGGIDAVRWRANPWDASVDAVVTSAGCVSGTCLSLAGLPQWSGAHLYYAEPFPTSSFTALSFAVRTTGGTVELTVAPSLAGAPCTETVVTAGPTFTTTRIELASVCSGTSTLDAVTVQVRGATSLVFDDVRFEP